MPATPAATKGALVATLGVTAGALGAFAARRPESAVDPGFAAWFLWLFAGLFLLRVVGQLLVRARRTRWLPPTELWNLSPYRLLLPTQLAILGLMAWIGADLSRAGGVFADPSPEAGFALVLFSYVYASAMAARYVVRMRRRPGQRWFGGAIPIVFHVVLAAYLYVLGSFHASY